MPTAVVVYESIFGNTKAIAEAIARGLEQQRFDVTLAEVSTVQPEVEADLLVVGGPIHAWGMTRASTREGARQQAAEHGKTPVSTTIGVRDWLDRLAPGAHDAAAAFDTAAETRWFPVGSAARGEAKRLTRRGFRVIASPEHFYVTDTEGPLKAGELERAVAWGERLGKSVVDERAAGAA